MKKQRHIYFFLPNFSIGGAGNSIFNICKQIKNTSSSIKIISIGKNHYKKAFKEISKTKKGHKIISEVYSHEGYVDTKDSDFDIVRQYEKAVHDMK